MDEHVDRTLNERVESLEDAVKKLQHSLEILNSRLSKSLPDVLAAPREPAEPPKTFVQRTAPLISSPAPKPTPKTPQPVPSARKSFELPEHMRKSEFWLNKIGIGLILFAVVFLFKYSIDQGWLTPTIRILFGLGLGTTLLIIGFRIYSRKKHFSQVLSGGAIATYYITGFAAFQLFSLVPHSVAFGFMVGITVLAFVLSLKQDQAIFSLIGTLGGLGTPFLLYSEAGSVPGLILYTCLVLAGTGAVYFYRGWCSLLWLSTLGGWVIFLISLIEAVLPDSRILADQWAVQSGILFGWLMFWAVPLLREVASSTNTARWCRSTIGLGGDSVSRDLKAVLDHHVFILTALVPIITLGMSTPIWPALSDATWGWITLAGAAVYASIFWMMKRRKNFENLAATHAIMGLIFFTVGLSLLLEGDTLLIAFSAEAAALHLIARKIPTGGTTVFAHILFGITALWLVDRLNLNQISRLMEPLDGTPIINARALTDLVVIGLGILMSIKLRTIIARRIYFIGAVAAIAVWLCRELQGSILLIALTAEAVALHAIALYRKDRVVAGAGHVLFGALGIWLAVRLFNPHTEEIALFNMYALVNLLAILVVAFLFRLLKTSKETQFYRLTAHILFLGWLLSELVTLENGQGYVTIAWGTYSAVILVLGLLKDYHQLRSVAMITLFVVVAKLFLIDLANLEVLWRILLFMGFGGLFLFLSYYFQDLWKGKTDSTDDSD